MADAKQQPLILRYTLRPIENITDEDRRRFAAMVAEDIASKIIVRTHGNELSACVDIYQSTTDDRETVTPRRSP